MGVNSLFLLISENRQKWTANMWTEIIRCVGFILTHNAEEDRDVLFRDRDITKRSSDETKGILEPRPPLTPPAPMRRNGRRNRDRLQSFSTSELPSQDGTPGFDSAHIRVPDVCSFFCSFGFI